MKPNEVVMGNFKSITVNVGDHDEQLALERKAVREVVEGLKKRIFFSRMQGINATTMTWKQALRI